eukprot:scaffold17122_cov113-Isochrysis_galbana.AAC.2
MASPISSQPSSSEPGSASGAAPMGQFDHTEVAQAMRMFGGNPAMALAYLVGSKKLPAPPGGFEALDPDGAKYEAWARAKAQRDAEQREVDVLRHRAELKRRRAVLSNDGALLWGELAGPVGTDEQVAAFFHRRQSQPHPGEGKLRILSMVRLANRPRLQAFTPGGDVHLRPTDAATLGADTLLFHGCKPEAATNIQADGLLLRYARQTGMLGPGLYGAPDPRKSWQYCAGTREGFVFVCRFNLAHPAKHAGPQTPHRNSMYDEYCVFDEDRVVVLWILKMARDAAR